MTTEEKAKSYDEALERAREFQKSKDGLCVLTAESIFPELRKSEDERIREDIMILVKDWWDRVNKDNISTKEQMIAWLEKQGEKKPINDTDEEIVKARLWDITKDAKDGDVLYSLDSKQPFIFKHRKPNEQAEAYCGLNIYGKFFVWGTKDCVITLSNYIPATKEQRDLLFQKMKEDGYEWDAEKKELKKIHVIDEGKAEMDYCFTKMMAGEKANPTWNVEDSSKVQRICQYLDEAKKYYADITEVRECIEWLKSLKERVQPKQEWSDEDEENLQHCCGAVFAADYYTYEDKQDMEKWLLQLKERLL